MIKTALKYRIDRAIKATVADVAILFDYQDWLEYQGARVVEALVKSQSGEGEYQVLLALQGDLLVETMCSCPDYQSPELNWAEDRHPAGVPYYSNLLGRHRLCKHALLALRKVVPGTFKAIIAQEREIRLWTETRGHRGLVSTCPWEIKDAAQWARNVIG